MGPPAVKVRFGDLVGRHQGDDAVFSKRWRFELPRCRFGRSPRCFHRGGLLLAKATRDERPGMPPLAERRPEGFSPTILQRAIKAGRHAQQLRRTRRRHVRIPFGSRLATRHRSEVGQETQAVLAGSLTRSATTVSHAAGAKNTSPFLRPPRGLSPGDATTDSYQAPENSAVLISQARSLRNEFALAIEHLPLAGEMEKAVASMQKVLDGRIVFRLAIVIAGILLADDRRTAIASTAGKRFASRSVRQATAGGRHHLPLAGKGSDSAVQDLPRNVQDRWWNDPCCHRPVGQGGMGPLLL